VKEIIYAGGTLLTGDAIADALLDAAAALAEAQLAEPVDIPVVDAEGNRDMTSLLLGPASQIVTRHAGGSGAELVDEGTIVKLGQLVARLRPVAATDDQGPTGPDIETDLDMT
jgi:hypothetical protein